MLSGGSSGSGGSIGNIQSMSSGLGNLNRDHELVCEVQQKAGVQDPKQARQYTQQEQTYSINIQEIIHRACKLCCLTSDILLLL
jgi:hypothetical protein